MKLDEKVYKVLKKVPKGKVTTYKVLAEKAGTKSYRAVGQAMRRNPYAPKVPCHRVVSSDGRIGGFCGETTGSKIKEKISLLKKEGVSVEKGKIKNFDKKLWR